MREYLVTEELDNYRLGWITRREFIRRAALIGVAAATASAMARTVTPAKAQPASGPQVSPFHVDPDDPRITSDTFWFPSDDGTQILAYQAWPAGAAFDGSHPGVVVIHQNRGLVEHLKDVARRFAVQGYTAIAPDFISRLGTPAIDLSSDDQARAYATLDSNQSVRDGIAALSRVAADPTVDAGKLAATGYCAGGSITWLLATMAPNLAAVAPFYGTNPPLDAVPNIRAAVLAVYGGLDERVDAGIPDIEAAMKAAGTTYEIKVYPNSQHAFHDDTSQAYNPTTAPEAWIDTLSWFADKMGLPAPMV